MKPRPLSQGGQALVLIVLAAVGLFAFAALAIDGSAVFSDRRHSQNASDTAAFAAALARVRNNPSWDQVGKDRAIANGYDESDGITEVYVHLCSVPTSTSEGVALTCQGLPAGANPAHYVHVYIKSVVNMSFARILGWQQVINRTDAVVRATPAEFTEWFDGMALVAAMTGCAGPGEFGPFEVGGNGTTIVNNSGIFVNSSCGEAFVDNGNSNVVTTDPTAGVCVVGGVESGVTGVTPPPNDYCAPQIDISQFWLPDSEPPTPNLLAAYCASAGSIDDLGGGIYEANPGYFETSPQTFPDVSPAGVLKLKRGVYCLRDGMVLNGNWTFTTDLDGDDAHDPDTEGVFFYVTGGDFKLNGGSGFEVHAINSTAAGFPPELLNYLLYIPPSNHAQVEISGNNGSTFTGTILAPTSSVDIIGNGEALELHTQIIGYNTRISGSGTVDITYDPEDNAPAIKLPKLSPIE
jgi:Putative Flp pilus-assembly TadE/G-like